MPTAALIVNNQVYDQLSRRLASAITHATLQGGQALQFKSQQVPRDCGTLLRRGEAYRATARARH